MVAYAFSPIDLIPDVIPVLGYLDDLILVPLGIRMALGALAAGGVEAANRPQALQLQSRAVLVMRADTGEVLYRKNAEETLPIASITHQPDHGRAGRAAHTKVFPPDAHRVDQFPPDHH